MCVGWEREKQRVITKTNSFLFQQKKLIICVKGSRRIIKGNQKFLRVKHATKAFVFAKKKSPRYIGLPPKNYSTTLGNNRTYTIEAEIGIIIVIAICSRQSSDMA